MAIENVLLEVFGLACPMLLTYAATQHFAFEPLTIFGKGHNKATNDLYITAIPAVIYLTFRLYFAFIMAGSCKVPASYRSYLAGFLVIMGMLAPFFHPLLQTEVLSLYEAYLGQIMKIIYDSSEADFKNAIVFGQKIFFLLAGWYVVFLVVEMILRVIFMFFRGVYSAVMSAVYGTKTVKRLVKKVKDEVEVEEEEEQENNDKKKKE